MAKVIGIHRLALKPGVTAAEFEEFVANKVFPGLGVVIHADKTISHGITIADWLRSQHRPFRPHPDAEDRNYLP